VPHSERVGGPCEPADRDESGQQVELRFSPQPGLEEGGEEGLYEWRPQFRPQLVLEIA